MQRFCHLKPTVRLLILSPYDFNDSSIECVPYTNRNCGECNETADLSYLTYTVQSMRHVTAELNENIVQIFVHGV